MPDEDHITNEIVHVSLPLARPITQLFDTWGADAVLRAADALARGTTVPTLASAGVALRVPGRETVDPDVDALRAQIDRLRKWKAEALAVLAEWDQVFLTLGSPGSLGQTRAAAVLEAIRQTAATVEDVEPPVTPCLSMYAAVLAAASTFAEQLYISADATDMGGVVAELDRACRSVLAMEGR